MPAVRRPGRSAAGFLAASAGAGRTAPNRFIVMVYDGALVLPAGLTTLGIGLLVA